MENIRRMSKVFFISCFLGGQVLGTVMSVLVMVIMPALLTSLLSKPCSGGACAVSDEGLTTAELLLPLALSPGIFFLLCSALAVIIFIVDMWRSIQDGHARTSPGLAFALLLIPVFNIYWAFQALWGLAKDYNAYIRRYHVRTPALPEGLFLTASITFSLSYLPTILRLLGLLVDSTPGSGALYAVICALSVAGNLAGLANLIIIPIIMSKGCDAANAIRQVAA